MDQGLKTTSSDNTVNKRKATQDNEIRSEEAPTKYQLLEKITQPNYTMASIAAITTKNQYAPLADNAGQSVHTKTHTPHRNTKIPPIITIDLSHTHIKNLMTIAKVNAYHIKYMTIGTKILFDNIKDYSNAKATLHNKNIHFYTHDIPNEKTIKFVLSGLHDLPINEVKDGLQAENINFLDVKKMTTRNNTHIKPNNSCLYIVYFANELQTKLNELKAHKYIMNAVVRWSPYIHTKNGPTQCSRCQLYGHGNKNCNLAPRCMFCSGKHETEKCTIQASTSSATPPTPKCCLCSGDHTSKDKNCPKRMEYISMRIRTSQRQPPPRTSRAQPYELPGRIDNLKDYPALPRSNPPRFNHWFNANTNSHHQPHQPHQPPPSASRRQPEQSSPDPSHRPPPHTSQSELFSMEELLQLSRDLINTLSRCKTKHDQFQVVTDLTIKYLYNDK